MDDDCYNVPEGYNYDGPQFSAKKAVHKCDGCWFIESFHTYDHCPTIGGTSMLVCKQDTGNPDEMIIWKEDEHDSN